MSVLRKRNPVGDRGGSARPSWTEQSLKRWPGLFEFLTAVEYSPGDSRTPGSVTLFAEDGQEGCKACLNDKDQEQSAYVTGAGPLEALDALEKGLQKDSLDWRSWRGKKGVAKKK